MLNIIEQFIMGKSGSLDGCEDALVITDSFVAVLDGVTSKSEELIQDLTTGQMAVNLIERAIHDMPKDITCEAAVERMTGSIARFYEEQGMTDRAKRYPEQRLAACAAVFSIARKEIWLIGDCQCAVDGVVHCAPKALDDIIAEARALYLTTELRNGKTIDDLRANDTGREFVFPLLKRAMMFQNDSSSVAYGYAVLDGFPVSLQHVVVIPVSESTSEIVLATDGYPELHRTLKRSEQRLQELISHDPLCIDQFKSTKGLAKGNISFDDRTYIRIALTDQT